MSSAAAGARRIPGRHKKSRDRTLTRTRAALFLSASELSGVAKFLADETLGPINQFFIESTSATAGTGCARDGSVVAPDAQTIARHWRCSTEP